MRCREHPHESAAGPGFHDPYPESLRFGGWPNSGKCHGAAYDPFTRRNEQSGDSDGESEFEWMEIFRGCHRRRAAENNPGTE